MFVLKLSGIQYNFVIDMKDRKAKRSSDNDRYDRTKIISLNI